MLTWNVAGVVRQWVVDVSTLIQIGRRRAVAALTNAERRSFFLPTLVPTSIPATTVPTATSSY